MFLLYLSNLFLWGIALLLCIMYVAFYRVGNTILRTSIHIILHISSQMKLALCFKATAFDSLLGLVPEGKTCHPSARKFIEDFEGTKDDLIVEIVKILNKTVFNDQVRNLKFTLDHE